MAARYELKKTSNAKYVFNLMAGNGQVVLTSQTYEAKASALGGIDSVRKNGLDDGQYQRLLAKDGSPYFTLTAANSLVIGQSQMYSSTSARDGGIQSVQSNAASAEMDDQTL